MLVTPQPGEWLTYEQLKSYKCCMQPSNLLSGSLISLEEICMASGTPSNLVPQNDTLQSGEITKGIILLLIH